MQGRVYRGTDFQQAKREEFATKEIHGDTFEIYEGWMDPEDGNADQSAQQVGDLPWEAGGPSIETVAVTGGISDRLGAAESFAGGGLPVVFHLDESQIPNLLRVNYEQSWHENFPGSLAWVNGSVDGEVYVNGQLRGLTKGDGYDATVAYWGEHFADYPEEMEQLVMGEDRVPIDGAVHGVVSYVRQPVQHLSTLDGYHRLDTKMVDDEDTIVGDWSDERAASVLYDEFRDAVPAGWDAYLVHTNTMLVQETWGYDPGDVEAVYGVTGKQSVEDAPDYILGD